MSDEIRFRGPFGIAVTADGAFYVSEIQGRRVAKFSRTGDFVGELKHIEGYGELRGPFDVAVGKSGNLYIADTRGHSVLVLDTADNLTLRLGDGEPAAAPGAFHEPHFVDVNEALQRIVVADTLNNRVQVFDLTGNLVKILGETDLRGPGGFTFATGVALDRDGTLYAINWSGGFVNIYDAEFRLTRTFGERGSGAGRFNNSYSIALNRDAIWVADTYNNRLQQFSKEWQTRTVLGGREGSGSNQFSHPTDLGFDAVGNIYVADWKNDRVLKLDPAGNFIRAWGSPAAVTAYSPPAIHERKPGRGSVSIGAYCGIGPAEIQSAARNGVEWIYVSFANQAGEWNIRGNVDDAHRHGVKVAASIAVYQLGAQNARWKSRPELYMGKRGEDAGTSLSLSYFFPEVRRWKARHLAEQAAKSGIDGILLDYIRYPNTICGYEPAMVEEFERETGRDPTHLAPDDWDWLKFRAKYITLFITELRYELAQLGRPPEISVFVGPDWKHALRAVAHDWREWVRMGIVDKVCLGLYSRDLQSLYEGIRQAKATCPEHTRVSAFIACWGGNLNTPELLTKGAEMCFAANADEITVYRGDAITQLGLWDTIGNISRVKPKRE